MADSSANDALQVSVVIPTIGRAELLGRCLESISQCRPRADEIIVVDQSNDDAVCLVVERFSETGAAC